MRVEVLAFDAREGGTFRMAFIYEGDGGHGRTTDNADVFEGRFAKLVPGRRVVELVEFESDDPAFAATMRIVTAVTFAVHSPRTSPRLPLPRLRRSGPRPG